MYSVALTLRSKCQQSKANNRTPPMLPCSQHSQDEVFRGPAQHLSLQLLLSVTHNPPATSIQISPALRPEVHDRTQLPTLGCLEHQGKKPRETPRRPLISLSSRWHFSSASASLWARLGSSVSQRIWSVGHGSGHCNTVLGKLQVAITQPRLGLSAAIFGLNSIGVYSLVVGDGLMGMWEHHLARFIENWPSDRVHGLRSELSKLPRERPVVLNGSLW